MAFRMQVQCLTIYANIYNLNANVYVNQKNKKNRLIKYL